MNKKLLDDVLAAHARGEIRKYEIEMGGMSVRADGPEDHARAMEALDKMKVVVTGLPASAPAATGKQGPMLHEALDLFLEQFKRRGLAPATLLETEHSITLFRDLIDDMPLWDVDHAQIDIFRDALAHWPARARVLPAYKNLGTRAIVERGRAEPTVPKLHVRTVEKHLDRMRVFFNEVLRRRQVPFNPLSGLRLQTTAAKYTLSHRAFRPDELQRIFDPQLRDTHCSKDAHFFWLPLMCLFTGARLNEIARLQVTDFELFEKGIWGIHITPEAGRLKNAQSKRFIPLPDRLVELRLPEYAQDTASAGFKLLFPGGSLTSKNGPGDRVSKWFNRTFLDKACGLTDPMLCFHSFRHTQQTIADRLGITEAQIAPISGHAPRSVQAKHYIDRQTVLERKARLDLIAEALNLPRLDIYMRGQFDRYFQDVRSEEQHAAAAAQRATRSPV